MNSIHFLALPMLHFLWLLPLFAALLLYGFTRRRQALARFIENPLFRSKALGKPGVDRRWKSLLLLSAVIFLVVGMARPAWNEKEIKVKRQGRDVVFLLDVSRSMLAEDLAPNRLTRAKIAINDAVEVLQGDRVALVAFAGEAAIRCPLTLDYGFFRMMLDAVDTESVPRGGTLLGDAVRFVMKNVFDDQARQYKDIVLITDGGDHESFPVEAAKDAGDKGIRLIVVGLGDEKEGRRIPITGTDGRKRFLTYKGEEVWSKLDGDTLRRMALATPGGFYLPVATGSIDLGKVYRDLIANAAKKELEERKIERYEEKFQIFIGLALLLLILEMLL